MTDKYFAELSTELQKATEEKNHPFRYCTLATVGVDNMVRQRIVVLRKVGPELLLTFFTDYRSKKIMHIHENNRVSLLLYHPGLLLQLRIDGLAEIDKDEAAIKAYWKSLNESSRKSYTTVSAPGSELVRPESVEYLSEKNYFCAVNVTPFKIEYLKLKDPDHLRIHYSKSGNQWEGGYLVP